MNESFYDKKLDSSMIDASDIVADILDNVCQSSIRQGNQLITAWRAIVESIKPKANTKDAENSANFGKNLASHSRIVDFKNGILLVEADHSSWLQMFQLYKKYILGCIQRRFPDLNVSTLAFRLRGSNVGLSKTYEECLKIERAKQTAFYDKQEKILEEKGFIKKIDSENIPELPPVLKEIFDKMRESLLTNEK